MALAGWSDGRLGRLRVLCMRQKNIGWRIDYVLASPGARPFIRDAFVHPHVLGSDHCPVGVELAPEVVG